MCEGEKMRDNWFCFLPHPQTMDSVIDKVVYYTKENNKKN